MLPVRLSVSQSFRWIGLFGLSLLFLGALVLVPHVQATPALPVPLYRLTNGLVYLYTTNEEERAGAIANYGYSDDGIAAYVFAEPRPNTVPLYRLRRHDYLYTTNPSERDSAISQYGYIDEGIAAYVYARPIANTVPLYRVRAYAHFYTISIAERDQALANGAIDEGIAAYVFDDARGPKK